MATQTFQAGAACDNQVFVLVNYDDVSLKILSVTYQNQSNADCDITLFENNHTQSLNIPVNTPRTTVAVQTNRFSMTQNPDGTVQFAGSFTFMPHCTI